LPAHAFETVVLPHLEAARSLAWQIMRNDADGEDVSQEAVARALRFFDGFAGRNPRAWLLQIVRNTAYHFLRQDRARERGAASYEVLHPDDAANDQTPERLVFRATGRRLLNEAVGALPSGFRRVFMLRELEGLSYKEIAAAIGIPIGTVMSRLSRARRQLRDLLGAGASTVHDASEEGRRLAPEQRLAAAQPRLHPEPRDDCRGVEDDVLAGDDAADHAGRSLRGPALLHASGFPAAA